MEEGPAHGDDVHGEANLVQPLGANGARRRLRHRARGVRPGPNSWLGLVAEQQGVYERAATLLAAGGQLCRTHGDQ